MRFCLYSEENELKILGAAQNMALPTFNHLELATSSHDESDASKHDLQTANNCFMNQFACNIDEYIANLEKTPHYGQWGLYLECKCNSDTGTTFTLTVSGYFLRVLTDVFGTNSEIRVQLSQANTKCVMQNNRIENLTTHLNVSNAATKGMKIVGDSQVGTCTDQNVDIPTTWKTYLNTFANKKLWFYAKLKIEFSSLGFNMMSSTSLTQSEFVRSTQSNNLNKRILEEGIQSDVTIIGSNGIEIKCHKNFLAAQSPVFTAMFRSDCKESSTSKIEMEEMDEEVVTAFLAYLYYGDLTRAEENSHMTFDLFEAGHKYEVKSLEEDAKRILLMKPTDWIDVGVALRLFSIYGKMEGQEDLRTKAIQVMKAKFQELAESEDYKELFSKDPEGAMELCKSFAT